MSESDWYMDQLSKYKGWTVFDCLHADPGDDDEGFFALILQNSESHEKVAVWFYSDDEGNAPGSFMIQEM